MDLPRIAKETSGTLVNYLTYQAVRVVIEQLAETDPPRSLWLRQFSADYTFQRAEEYLHSLMQQRQDLALRIMTVRENLADEIADFLPEMTRTDTAQANMAQRRQMFERMTLVSLDRSDNRHPELDEY